MTEDFRYRDERLFAEELSVDALADRFGTPLYLYSAAALRTSFRALRELFPPDAEILFSVKANASPQVAAIFRELGSGVELASAGELAVARRAGFSPTRMVFAGPGKTDQELIAWIEAGGGLLNVESLGEARRADALAAARGKRIEVCLRINPSDPGTSAGMAMGGHALPFGVDQEQAAQVLRALDALPNLRLRGVHVFVGTQTLDAAGVGEVVSTGFELASLYSDALGRACEIVDVGPGLGVATFENETDLDLDDVKRRIDAVLPRRPAGARLLVEAGRFLTANAGIYVTTVVDVKESRGTCFAITDGGLNHHAAAAGGFGNMFRRNYPIAPTLRRASEANVIIVGPCCTSADRFGSYRVPALRPGDRLAFLKSGAYGLSSSHLLFLSHESPAEVMVDGSQATLVRERAQTGCLFVPDRV